MQEYWIVQSDFENILIYTLVNGTYIPTKLFASGDMISSKVKEGFSLDLYEHFALMDE